MESDSIFNIGPTEQRKRAVVGVAGLVMAIAVLVGLRVWGVFALWRLLTFPFFFVATIGLLQAREKT
jgi:hypothetical protein